MASTYTDYITTLCPSLSTSPSLDIYVEMAQAETGQTFFGDKYDLALALRACHLFTIDKNRPDGTGGFVTSKTESRTSIHYWNSIPNEDNSNLNATTYGQRLKALIRSIGSGISIGVAGVL